MTDETDDTGLPDPETSQPPEATEPASDQSGPDAETPDPALTDASAQPPEDTSLADIAPVIAKPEPLLSPANLHDRLTKAARAAALGGQEQAHALNQLELLTGQLKYVLPAVIALIQDEGLQTDLQCLLSAL